MSTSSWYIIPCDIHPEILSFLPAKTLFRFRTVSKSWRDLIDCPDFVKKHLCHSIKSNNNLKLIIPGFPQVYYNVDFNRIEDGGIIDIIPLNYPHPLETTASHCNVLGCCNGLICVKIDNKSGIILCNPSTRRYQNIPRITKLKLSLVNVLIHLSIYGFGYDIVNDDYKLVRIIQFEPSVSSDYSLLVYIYSLKYNCWRRIERVIPYKITSTIGVFVGGLLHWTGESGENNTIGIICFDFGTEEYREIPKPEYKIQVDNEEGDVHILGGDLCFVNSYLHDSEHYTDIWVMKEYGIRSSWTKLVSVTNDWSITRCLMDGNGPLAYSKCGKKMLLKDSLDNKLVWYDLKKKDKTYVTIRHLIQLIPHLFVSIAWFDSTVASPTPLLLVQAKQGNGK